MHIFNDTTYEKKRETLSVLYVSGGLAVLEAFHQWIKLNEYSLRFIELISVCSMEKKLNLLESFFVSISASKWQASNRNQIGL